MRIGFALLTLFPGRVGGAETYVRGLLGEYASGAGPGEVVVLANRHVMASYHDFARGPVSFCHVDSYRPGDGTATRTLAMTAAALAPSRTARGVPSGLELVHYAVTVPIPATAARRVVTLHDIQHHDLPELFPRAERAYRRWAYDGSARNAAVVVTSSAYSKERIVTLLGIPAERVEAVHLGIDHARFTTVSHAGDERELAGLDLPERFALYPANLWPHKNHERLLDALGLLPDRELGLVLTGQGYGRLDGLLRRARVLGIASRVGHLGHVAAEILPALYRRATALVFPSLYEGFGAPPLEAMACGCPVAASNRTSIPEVVGQAALLFDPHSVESIAEALDRVTSDEELRGRLRAAGLERARAFTWHASAERHAKIYARVAAT